MAALFNRIPEHPVATFHRRLVTYIPQGWTGFSATKPVDETVDKTLQHGITYK